MTDGSEISSLNEEEATDLRQKYKEIMVSILYNYQLIFYNLYV